jgi:hypothetical protein
MGLLHTGVDFAFVAIESVAADAAADRTRTRTGREGEALRGHCGQVWRRLRVLGRDVLQHAEHRARGR